ncbi:MAG: zinc-ribbon domain-containing protein [Candidatus Pelagibacter sp.]|tara:strand:+ start:516 stop:971 length:456 start_codon:yes stop_codon:yes gene_type:complete
MIINCQNCNKKFNVNSNLIGDNGRLLQCSNCNHKWFFKIAAKFDEKNNVKNDIDTFNKEDLAKTTDNEDLNKIEISSKKNNKLNNQKPNLKKNYLYGNYFIIVLISLTSLIILIDTFESGLSILLPGLPSMLANLYESFYNMQLFLKDLIS